MKKEKIEEDKKRTMQQNNALHLWYEQVAKTLNENCHFMQEVLNKAKIDLKWGKESVKYSLWLPVMIARYHKEHTAQLDRNQINDIVDSLNKFFGEKFGIHIPFPSDEELMLAEKKIANRK